MSSIRSRQIITTGLAMFSMFFGAGNIVFPLMIGKVSASLSWYAILGLLITAVGVPFIGLVAMTHYNGDYKSFFSRIGVIPGALVTLFIMILIGPMNAIPRCIALSYGTLNLYVPSLSQFMFSLGSCIVIFLATYKRSRIVDLLGDVLSPLLVASLGFIAIKGLLSHPAMPLSSGVPGSMFLFGIEKGYNTMDLLGTYFFSSVIIRSLKGHFPEERDNSVLAGYALKASVIGAALLGGVYVSFARLAAYYGDQLSGLNPEVLLGTMAHLVLGPLGGLVVSVAVALACLTTAITLASVFAEYLQREVFRQSVGYIYCLGVTLIASCVFANFDFSQIVGMIEPILAVGYPALIVMTVVNWMHKSYGFSYIVSPVAFTAITSFLWHHGSLVSSFVAA